MTLLDPVAHLGRSARARSAATRSSTPTSSSRARRSSARTASSGSGSPAHRRRRSGAASRSRTTACSSTAASATAPRSGPFAHLRPGIGSRGGRARRQFRRDQEDAPRARHARRRTSRYLGDAEIGAGCNIGAGTITCNYDGDAASTGRRSAAGRLHRQRHPARGARRRSARAPTSAPGTTVTEDVPAGRAGASPASRQRQHRGLGRTRRKKRSGQPAEASLALYCSAGSGGSSRMCGIVGYIGPKDPVEVLIEGLRRLEYRGYDSAGHRGRRRRTASCSIRRARGQARATSRRCSPRSRSTGRYGIGHTRWATHGRPTEENAHPHRDCTGRLVVIHNGIIENYLELKHELAGQGPHASPPRPTPRSSRTRSSSEMQGPGERPADGLPRASCRACAASTPSSRSRPTRPTRSSRRASARRSSSASARASSSSPPTSRRSSTHTKDVVFLDDGEVVVVRPDGADVPRRSTATPIDKAADADPLGPDHGREGRLQALHAQGDPRAAARRPRHAARPRLARVGATIYLEEIGLTDEELRDGRARCSIVACGTSWHAGLVGQVPHRAARADPGRGRLRVGVPLSRAARRRPARCRSSSASRARPPTRSPRCARRRPAARRTLAICNVRGLDADARGATARSTRTPGPEIGVASTKAFTSQITALTLCSR